MFLTTHAAAGIAISRYLDDPVAVFSLAFASHFILDFIPHGDENLYRDHEWKHQHRFRRVIFINALDLVALIILTLWAIQQPMLNRGNLMTIAILGSILPDFLSHLFPVLHQRLSWLWLVRWLYSLTLPTGLRFFVRAQNWLHQKFHHDLLHKDVSARTGLFIQVALVLLLLLLSR